MTAYFTDPMGDEFKKAMEEALKKSKIGKDDPDATKRSQESKRSKLKTKEKRKTRQRLSREDARKLR